MKIYRTVKRHQLTCHSISDQWRNYMLKAGPATIKRLWPERHLDSVRRAIYGTIENLRLARHKLNQY